MSLAAAQFDADVRQFPDYDIVHRADRAYYPTVAWVKSLFNVNAIVWSSGVKSSRTVHKPTLVRLLTKETINDVITYVTVLANKAMKHLKPTTDPTSFW